MRCPSWQHSWATSIVKTVAASVNSEDSGSTLSAGSNSYAARLLLLGEHDCSPFSLIGTIYG